MGVIEAYAVTPAKLFCALMYNESESTEGALRDLVDTFGNIESESNIFDFNHTGYYEKEFGSSLKKRFIVFEKSVKQESLADIKVATNSIEDAHCKKDGRRIINIDPGFILPSRLILASTKEYSHRIYVGKGIYAEVTLMFTKNGVKHLDWTYPDYKSAGAGDFLLESRNMHNRVLKENKK